jgi:predicted nucleic acid-binding protein
VDLEVASALRRLTATGDVPPRRALLALEDLAALPVVRLAHTQLITRCWELRSNLTPYDAAYVAAAELFESTLLTADTRIAGAPGVRCAIEVIASDGAVAGGA